MNTQFACNVHEFTENLFKAMLEEFDGLEVGSDEFNLETLMGFHFPNYKPGDKVKKMKKMKDPNAPKRALSGYTYFGKMNKEKINKEIEKAKDTLEEGDSPPKYVTIVAKLWGELSEADQKKWTKKAADYDAKAKAKAKAEALANGNDEGGEE